MENQNNLRSAKIVIGKDRFQIQTDLNESELDEIVQFVEKKYDQYVGDASAVDAKKRLELMALDIASEYFDLRRRYVRLRENDQNAQKEIVILNELMDRTLLNLE